MSRLFFLLTVIIAALLALLVTAMNAAPADIELAFLHVSAPLGVALVVAFTVGMLAGLLWRAHWIAELLSERGRLRRALKVAESQDKRRRNPLTTPFSFLFPPPSLSAPSPFQGEGRG